MGSRLPSGWWLVFEGWLILLIAVFGALWISTTSEVRGLKDRLEFAQAVGLFSEEMYQKSRDQKYMDDILSNINRSLNDRAQKE